MRRLALLGLVFWTARLAAQGPPVFRGAADLVNVIVSVSNPKDLPVPGLAKDAFVVLEDGKRQEIALFTTEEQPISVALVLDTSGSMEDKIDDLRDAVHHFINGLKSRDEMFLLRFSNTVELLSEPGDSRDRLRRAVDRLRPVGGTALFDGVAEGIATLQQAHHDKRALLLVTDGNDNASRIGRREVTSMLARSEVLLYGLGIGHGERGSFGHDSDRVDIDLLERLADPTGGRSMLLEAAHRNGVDRIDEAVEGIGAELRQQYSLGYYSTNTAKDGTFRRIQVKVSDSSYRVHARSGYFAPKSRGHVQ